jgi:hypothetical protein
MKILITILALFLSAQARSQNNDVDDFVRTVTKLRKDKKLTAKIHPDKTFVGSLTGYYDKDSLVLINTLTDAEAAGTETLYFIQNGLVKRVYTIAAQFDSNEEWPEYFSKHKSANNCYACHSKPNCTVTVINFNDDGIVEILKKGKPQKITPDEKTKILSEALMKSRELTLLVKQLQ